MKLRPVKPVALFNTQKSSSAQRMKNDVDQVVASGFQPKHLHIKVVREEGQRRIIEADGMSESPHNRRPIEYPLHVRVFGHVKVVINVYKGIAVDRGNKAPESQ